MTNKRMKMPERMENLAKSLTGAEQRPASRYKELMLMPARVRAWSPADDLAYAIAIGYEVLSRKLASRALVAKYAGSRKEAVLKGIADLTRDEDRWPEKGPWLYELARTAAPETLLVAASISLQTAMGLKKAGRSAEAEAELKIASPVFAMIPEEEVAERVHEAVEKFRKNLAVSAGKGRTEMVLILDRSGSMSSMAKSTIKGFNDMIGKQRKLTGEANVSTVLFDDDYEVLHNCVDIRKVPVLTDREYYVRGCTALLDAIGRAITHMVNVQRHASPSRQAKHVLFVIITDGYENASHLYSARQVREMVEKEQRDYGWEFVFLGANIDAIAAAGDIGIKAERAVDYVADSEGTMQNFEAINKFATCLRENVATGIDWRENVDKDYRARSGKKKG